MFPKCWHWYIVGRGLCPLPGFFGEFVHNALRALQNDLFYHQKVIISPKKCALIPQHRSFNHIYLTFSLSKMIYAHISKHTKKEIVEKCSPFQNLFSDFHKCPCLLWTRPIEAAGWCFVNVDMSPTLPSSQYRICQGGKKLEIEMKIQRGGNNIYLNNSQTVCGSYKSNRMER